MGGLQKEEKTNPKHLQDISTQYQDRLASGWEERRHHRLVEEKENKETALEVERERPPLLLKTPVTA